jgi:formylglycine-generating enzyme required for sulfatase activity
MLAAQFAITAACGGQGSGLDGDATPDALVSDAATVDASLVSDGAVDDAGTDGSATDDLDGDGYPAGQDCDDRDDQIYPGVERECSSDCGIGTETCLANGQWSACTAPTDCYCTNPGETRQVACGDCGQQEQRCGSDLVWANQGDCTNEGVCSPGQQDQQSCSYCGTGVRVCQNDCQWGPPDCSGVCVASTVEHTSDGCTNPWEIRVRQCDSQCQWTPVAPCSDQCVLTPRQNDAEHKTELCIPGGEFIMGRQPGEGWGDDEPAHTVALTPYFIDKYEVTNDRYRECVSANACLPPSSTADYFQTGTENRPVVMVTYVMAEEFCLWDGGRYLPTEAQWEKAARGPAPREVLNPWGSAPATCELCAASYCAGSTHLHSMDVGILPLGVSYYGVHNMAGNAGELVKDWYSNSYYASGVYLDPPGPSAGTYRLIRGLDFSDGLSDYTETVTFRRYRSTPSQSLGTGFRCARPGY